MERTSEIEIAETLIAASQIVKDESIKPENNTDDDFFRLVVLFFVNHVLEVIEAMVCLTKAGYGRQTPILARSAYEASVKGTHLMLHKSPQLLILYQIQYARSLRKSINRLRLHMGGRLDQPEDKDVLLSEVKSEEAEKSLIDELNKMDPSLANRVREDKESLWPDKNLKAFVKEISPDFSWSYSTIYENSAEFSHANLGIITEYIEPKTDLSNFRRQVNADYYSSYLLSVCDLAISLWETMDRFGVVAKPKEIDTIRQQVLNVRREKGV